MVRIQACDALARVQCLTPLEVRSNVQLAIHTFQALANILASVFDHVPATGNPALDVLLQPTGQVPAPPKYRSIAPATNEPLEALFSSSAQVAVVDVVNIPSLTTSIQASPVRRGSQGHPQTVEIEPKKKPNTARHESAYRNARENTQRWLREKRRVRIKETLTRRITEYPPARAAADLIDNKKARFARLEGMFGAMLIAEEYDDFRRKQHEIQRSCLIDGRGALPAVFDQYAEHRGISDIKSLPDINKFGETLLEIWKTFPTQLGILVLVSRISTLRKLSARDAKRLKALVDGDEAVGRVSSRLSASVLGAREGYQKVAERLWSREKINTTMSDIKKCMNQDELQPNDAQHGGCQAEPEGCETEISEVSIQPAERRRQDGNNRTSNESSFTPTNDSPDAQTTASRLTIHPDSESSSANMRNTSLVVTPQASVGIMPFVDGRCMYGTGDEFVQNEAYIAPTPGLASTIINSLHTNARKDVNIATTSPDLDHWAWSADFGSFDNILLDAGGMDFTMLDSIDGGMEFLNR
ncbi:hypothetical protein LTR84_011966 [Exophiala bonariae]|uniref:BZIP domain-containing protein n=1 Tax=Exophiala bonariae TaxID=1690606 RepID=A0AAV9MUL5_9EURO|nr:hypothetical protein LTR84_011966 [Exophiala bonariae]